MFGGGAAGGEGREAGQRSRTRLAHGGAGEEERVWTWRRSEMVRRKKGRRRDGREKGN